MVKLIRNNLGSVKVIDRKGVNSVELYWNVKANSGEAETFEQKHFLSKKFMT